MDVSRQCVSAISWCVFGISTSATVGRYAIRYHDKHRFYWDDLTHALAWCFMFSDVVVYEVTFDGMYQDILQPYMPGVSVTLDPANPVYLFWLSVVQCMVGFLCLTLVKITFLLFYRQLFKSSPLFQKWWWGILALTLISYGTDLAGCLTVCGPASDLGNFSPTGCAAPWHAAYARSIVVYTAVTNILSDLAIMALPLFMLRRIQLRKEEKIGLAALFSIGVIIIIFDIVRVVAFFYAIASTTNRSGLALWSGLECNVAVLVSCLPIYRTLLPNKRKRQAQQHLCSSCQSHSVPTHSPKGIASATKVESQSSGSANRDLDHELGMPRGITYEDVGGFPTVLTGPDKQAY